MILSLLPSVQQVLQAMHQAKDLGLALFPRYPPVEPCYAANTLTSRKHASCNSIVVRVLKYVHIPLNYQVFLAG